MNTIQKFKQGRKIMKFQGGGKNKKQDNEIIPGIVRNILKLNPIYKTYNTAKEVSEWDLVKENNIPKVVAYVASLNPLVRAANTAYQFKKTVAGSKNSSKTAKAYIPKVIRAVSSMSDPAGQLFGNLMANYIEGQITNASQNSSSAKVGDKKVGDKKVGTKQEVKNKKAVEVPESILMTELSPEQLKVDLSTANRTPTVSQKEPTSTIITANPVVSQEVIPVKSTNEVIQNPYTNTGEAFTRQYVRSQRPLYSNVDELYDLINTYKDSRESQLIRNVLGNNFTYYQFKDLMNNSGIRGNLGRRDSRRLADYLNSLSYKNGGLLSKNPIQRFKLKRGGKFFKY